MTIDEQRALIGQYLGDLMASGWTLEIHVNPISGEYRVQMEHRQIARVHEARGGTLLRAIQRAWAGETVVVG